MIEVILDKGLVIDAYVRVSLIGIEILTIDARIVIASVDTYLRFAEAVNRLDIASDDGSQGLPELMEGMTEGGAKSKTKGALEGAKEKLGFDDDDDDGGEKKQRSRSAARPLLLVAALPQQQGARMSEVHVHGVVPAGRTHRDRVRRRPAGHPPRPGSPRERRRARAAHGLARPARALARARGGGGTATVLPVRFGTVMAGEHAVADEFLAPRYDELVAELAELAGKVQLTVKGFFEEEALMRGVVERSPAIARLRERVRGLPEAATYYERIQLGQLVAAEVERARERDTELVLERLEPLAVAASRASRPRPLDAAVNAAFLVERDRVDEFSRAVGRLGRELEGRVRLRYVGPLPPYSFAGDDATRGTRHGPDHRAAHAPARSRARHRVAGRAHPRAGRERVLRRARDPRAADGDRGRPRGGRDRRRRGRSRPRTSCSSA